MPSSLIDVIRQHAPTPTGLMTARRADEPFGLLAALARVPDPRDRRGIRYPLASLLAVAVCAVLAGAVTFAAITDWADDLDPAAGRRLGFTGRVPVLTTLWRLLVRVDASMLQAVLTDWLRSRLPVSLPAGRPGRRVIAIDGKVQRGARLPDGRQVHQLSAYDTTDGLVLAQVQIAAKSNEIPAFAPLLEQVAARLGGLNDVVFVADALHAQVAHAREVARLGGHLYVPVKANQPTLFAQLKQLPWADSPGRGPHAATVATDVGRPAPSRPGPLRSRVAPGHGVDEVVGSAVGASGGSGDVGFAVAAVVADGGVA